MITEIKLVNFLSFEDETFHLNKKQNVLVGINGSGKSNLLKALRLVKEGVSGIGLKKYVIDNLGGLDNILFKSIDNNKNSKIGLYFTLDFNILQKYGFRFTDDVTYSIEIYKQPSTSNYYVKENIQNNRGFIYLDFDSGNGVLNELDKSATYKKTALVKYDDFIESTELALSKIYDTDRYFALSTIRKAIGDIIVYDYFDTTPKSNIRKPMLPTSEKRLLPDGTNLPQILNTIKINHKSSYNKIAEMLNEVNPKFKGFDFNFIGGNIELMLEEEGLNSSVHVNNISDGTLRYLCLLSILFNPDRGSLICIDEPEVGLHPDMISNIGNSIIEASENSIFLISTHSENLLNCFNLENIRVFEKDERNSSKISYYEEKDFEGWYENFSIGKMWRQGDLGGNRW
ncbi:AAA family ATPase [Flavobacterium solisilvae]|uniref:AAA family ATPase n=1 Tax=Flavobacterium solisilvae TaxID=1852019 RepID=A0ABX1QRP7_9FLAO|nr:AAA family ATPase [Flavobacterium solisilvae]NMH24901.1 AAA family ATPase [Flavobacterium solisilvae]